MAEAPSSQRWRRFVFAALMDPAPDTRAITHGASVHWLLARMDQNPAHGALAQARAALELGKRRQGA